MQKQRTPKEHPKNMELHGPWNIQLIPKLGLKLKQAFQQITLYCHFCLTMVTPTLWYV